MRVETIPGVIGCHQIRVRDSGPDIFVDIHVVLDRGQSLAEAHHRTEVIKVAIRQLSLGAAITVHPES